MCVCVCARTSTCILYSSFIPFAVAIRAPHTARVSSLRKQCWARDPCSSFRSLWSPFYRQGVPRARSKGFRPATKEKWKLEMIWIDNERASPRSSNFFFLFFPAHFGQVLGLFIPKSLWFISTLISSSTLLCHWGMKCIYFFVGGGLLILKCSSMAYS